MPDYIPPSSGGGGGAVTSVAGRVGDVVLAESDIASLVSDLAGKAPSSGIAQSAVTGLVTALAAKAPTADPTFSGTATFSSTNIERGWVLGKAGAIGATETNAADTPFIVPYAATLKRIKVVLGVAATGAMAVQLRKAAAPGTAAPSYADVSGFLVTFANGSTIATATPGTAVSVSEGDVLNFSASTGSGQNLALEVVAIV